MYYIPTERETEVDENIYVGEQPKNDQQPQKVSIFIDPFSNKYIGNYNLKIKLFYCNNFNF